MIFATVGTQLPFPRMFASLAQIARERSLDVVAQTGDEKTRIEGITCHGFLPPQDYEDLFRRAEIVVSHAGVGTVLMAISARKPLVIMPRRVALGEHRNDHQMATAKALAEHAGIYVVHDTEDMDAVLARDDLEPARDVITPQREALQSYFSQTARHALGLD